MRELKIARESGVPVVLVSNWSVTKQPPTYAFDICEYASDTGHLDPVGRAHADISVGAACVDSAKGVVYCTDEVETDPDFFSGSFLGQERYRRGGGGRVFAFRIDPVTGEFREINHVSSFGSLPCSVAQVPDTPFIVVTNHTGATPITRVRMTGETPEVFLTYDDATTALFGVDQTGAIQALCDIYIHDGEPGPLDKQTHPQPHCVTAAPNGRFVVVCDKGTDELITLTVDKAARSLTEHHRVHTRPGGSPRDAVFHPTRNLLFVNYETAGFVDVFAYSPEGRLAPLHSQAVLPPDVEDGLSTWQSVLCVHPNGRFVYAMIRGLDTVSVFEVFDDGRLQRLQTLNLDSEPREVQVARLAQGQFPGGPRGGALSPDGQYLYAACPEADKVIVCSVGSDGLLTRSGESTHTRPASVTFA